MEDFKSVVINLVIVGVLVFAVFSWLIITQTNNNQTNLVTNNSLINSTYNDLYGQLGSAQGTGDSASQSFGNVTPSQSFGIVDVTSIVTTTKVFKSLTLGVYNVLIILPQRVLGVPAVVAGIIGAIVVLLLILGIWAIWRGVAT